MREPREIGPKTWGKLARRGAVRMEDDESGGASGAWRSAMNEVRPRPGQVALAESTEGHEVVDGPPVIVDEPEVAVVEQTAREKARSGRPTMQPSAWELVDEIEVETEASRAVERGRKASARTGSRAYDAPDDEIEGSVRAELARAVGTQKVDRYEKRLKDASRAFENERFTDAARMLKKLSEEAPTASAVRELYGLTLYRLGRWRAAAKELEAFRLLTSSTEQNPVLADCYRALHKPAQVAALWDELKAASPSAELVTEGRIVMAGSLADEGQVREAIRLLEQGFTLPKRVKEHQLRRAYALADCYERAGDLVRARELFAKVAVADPQFADARRRARSLG